ncbi:MAG TPA: AAA family ATPase [Pseudonocardiaceae bacterium]|nr:AAA family ATPase [Pseudonocardiaceae bacterium]
MTGRYEEPTPRYDAPWNSPSEPTAEGNHSASSVPAQEGPVTGAHAAPEPQYTDPTPSGEQPVQPAPNGFSQGPRPEATGSHQEEAGTQYIQPNPQYYDPNASGGFPAQPQPQQPPQFYDPNTGQPVPAPPVPFPFEQQYPPGGPAQPPPPPGYAAPGPYGPPGDLSRQAQAAVHDLSSAQLIRQTKRPPQSGWRKALYQVSAHSINLGESTADVHRRELIARINQPLRGCYKIAMLSLKGGVGKTTATTTLGSTFSSLRGDRVVAVDANPDRGTLSSKIPLETTATVRHLLRDADRITRYSDIRAYTSQGPSRLEVLASEQDPAVSEAFSEDDYRRTIDLLEHFYNVVLTDCGTGLMHSAMKGVLDLADSLVIVSSGSVDGARSASATLDWLDAHGYHDLVARSVAVINSVRPRSGAVDLDKLAEHFGSRCRAVCRIPFDPHLEEGAEIELERLAPATRLALLELGATVADDFPNDLTRR